MDDFSTRLRSLRNRHGWSQEFVGFELGVSKATVSKWETGRAEPSIQHLSALKRLYAVDGATLDWLIDGEFAPATSGRDAHESPPSPVAHDMDEAELLLHFRRLRLRQKRGLLALISGD